MNYNEIYKTCLATLALLAMPTLYLYTYYIFVGKFTIGLDGLNSWKTIILNLIFHFLYNETLVCYLLISPLSGTSTKDIFGNRKPQKDLVYRSFNPYIAEILQKKLKTSTSMCRICDVTKPPRAHHCSKCNICFLKMDHHCIWIDSCISFHNYKFYILFLIYGAASSIFVAIILAAHFNRVETTSSLFFFISCAAINAFIAIFLLINLFFHISLLRRNETTIENLALNDFIYNDMTENAHVFQEGPLTQLTESKERSYLNPYDLGPKKNFEQIFGTDWRYWFLPVYTSKGDGIHFLKNTTNQESFEFEIL